SVSLQPLARIGDAAECGVGRPIRTIGHIVNRRMPAAIAIPN
ncbi:hypothetical protein AB7M59_009087, partial [Bradyrhizobium elkanii]